MYFIIVGPAIILTIWAQIKVKSTFAKYSKINSKSYLSGKEAAQRLLEKNGIHDVTVKETEGWFTDHYDPRSKVLRLSPDVYRGHSLASIGVAAHEAGHAIQDAKDYTPLVMRQAIAPVAMFGSNIAMFLIFFGFIINALGLIKLGIIAFAIAVVFQIITLPVEFNASKRALLLITEYGIVTKEEQPHVASVLNAAAMTYVAAAIAAVAQLLYFLLRSGLLGGRDD